jgi:hypothetical protein
MKLDAYNILQYQIGDYVFGYRPNTPPGSVFNLNDTFAKVISKANLSTGTSSLTPVILDSLLIPANTVKTGDVIELRGLFLKVGTNAGVTVKMSLNTVNSAIGTQIGTFTSGSLQLFINKFMQMCVTPTGSYVLDPTSPMLNDEVQVPNVTTAVLNIDWSVDQYLILSGQVLNALDTLRSLGIKVVV